MKYIDYNGYRYWYEHKLAEDRVSICLATEDPLKYCNGLYLYSTKDPGDGMAFVVIKTNDPDYSNLPLYPMSLSNKELLDKTLFLKDSVLFISIDGKEYEVSNPEILFKPNAELTRIQKEYIIETLGKFEWPGGVELIDACASDVGIEDGKCDHCREPKKLARLLPKEKKEGSLYAGDNLHPRVEDIEKAESDYKQFEAHLPCVPAKKEPNLERLAGKLKPNYNHAQRIKRVESSEPQEKGRTCHDMCGSADCLRFGCEMNPKNKRAAEMALSEFYENNPPPVESQEELWKQFEEKVKEAIDPKEIFDADKRKPYPSEVSKEQFDAMERLLGRSFHQELWDKLQRYHQTLIARYYNNDLTEKEKGDLNKIIDEISDILK